MKCPMCDSENTILMADRVYDEIDETQRIKTTTRVKTYWCNACGDDFHDSSRPRSRRIDNAVSPK